MAADSSGDADYTCGLADEFRPPPDDDGVYILEEPQPDPVRNESTRPLSALRERAWMARRAEEQRGRKRERFQSDYVEPYWGRQQAKIGSSTLLKSSRRGRIEVDDVAWDERPPGFRADDGVKASDFYPHRGDARTARTMHSIPTNSEALSRIEVDQSTTDFRPCCCNKDGALKSLQREGALKSLQREGALKSLQREGALKSLQKEGFTTFEGVAKATGKFFLVILMIFVIIVALFTTAHSAALLALMYRDKAEKKQTT